MLTSWFPSLLSLSLLASASATNAVASSVFENPDTIEKRQSGSFAVTGVQDGAIRPRLEIRQLYNVEPDQWNLFLLGMQRFQQQVQSGQFSYYQIAGIHGVPNIPWDNVTANPNATGAVGYCPHVSVLFPAWHRPYVALFEQLLYENVQAVAQSFNGSAGQAYVAAAADFRLPYWDWAAAPAKGLPTFPLIISAKYAQVNTPTGQKTIINPLFRYTFNPLVPSDMLYQPWTGWSVTLRWPTNNGSSGQPQAVSQNNLAQNALENSRQSRADNLYNMFTLCSDYLEFSNDAASSSTAGCHTSLESIHNQIHSLAGGSNDGHMTWLWWSSFDPVFFLHHANVDRLFAMWQAIYPDSYGASQTAPGSTYTVAQNSVQDSESPLTPFHSDSNGDFWNTRKVQDHTVFGYTYPEFADSDGSTGAIMGYVNKLYGPNATATAGSSKAKRALASGLHSSAGQNFEYIANVAFQRFALNGSYTIYLFMGNPGNEDASQYAFDKNLIGSVSVFAVPGMSANKVISTGSVPLTRSLTAQIHVGILESLERLLVVPFLQEALQWRVVTASNQVIPNGQVPGLEVSVVTSQFTPAASSNEFPTYQPFAFLPDITDGKLGGLKLNTKAACELA